MGRAILAELSDEEIDDIYPEEKLEMLTDKTVSTKTELKRRLHKVKETGVSFDSEGTYLGSGGVASVIRDGSGVVVAALALAFPMVRINTRKCRVLSDLVQQGADLISYRLGNNNEGRKFSNAEELRSWWIENNMVLSR
jgi:DNA-binding IclR family transcriptional regulator